MHGHLAHDYPSAGSLSISGGNTGHTRGSSSKSGRIGPGRSRGRRRHVRFGGMNVLYDSEGYEHPVNDYGQIYVPLESEPADSMTIEEETQKDTRN